MSAVSQNRAEEEEKEREVRKTKRGPGNGKKERMKGRRERAWESARDDKLIGVFMLFTARRCNLIEGNSSQDILTGGFSHF